jgi:hypothetical protein
VGGIGSASLLADVGHEGWGSARWRPPSTPPPSRRSGTSPPSGIAGILWTAAAATVAFGYLVIWMLLACLALLLTASGSRDATAPPGPDAP